MSGFVMTWMDWRLCRCSRMRVEREIFFSKHVKASPIYLTVEVELNASNKGINTYEEFCEMRWRKIGIAGLIPSPGFGETRLLWESVCLRQTSLWLEERGNIRWPTDGEYFFDYSSRNTSRTKSQVLLDRMNIHSKWDQWEVNFHFYYAQSLVPLTENAVWHRIHSENWAL